MPIVGKIIPEGARLHQLLDSASSLQSSPFQAQYGEQFRGLTLSSYVRLLSCVQPAFAVSAPQPGVPLSAPLVTPHQSQNRAPTPSTHSIITAAGSQGHPGSTAPSATNPTSSAAQGAGVTGAGKPAPTAPHHLNQGAAVQAPPQGGARLLPATLEGPLDGGGDDAGVGATPSAWSPGGSQKQNGACVSVGPHPPSESSISMAPWEGHVTAQDATITLPAAGGFLHGGRNSEPGAAEGSLHTVAPQPPPVQDPTQISNHDTKEGMGGCNVAPFIPPVVTPLDGQVVSLGARGSETMASLNATARGAPRNVPPGGQSIVAGGEPNRTQSDTDPTPPSTLVGQGLISRASAPGVLMASHQGANPTDGPRVAVAQPTLGGTAATGAPALGSPVVAPCEVPTLPPLMDREQTPQRPPRNCRVSAPESTRHGVTLSRSVSEVGQPARQGLGGRQSPGAIHAVCPPTAVPVGRVGALPPTGRSVSGVGGIVAPPIPSAGFPRIQALLTTHDGPFQGFWGDVEPTVVVEVRVSAGVTVGEVAEALNLPSGSIVVRGIPLQRQSNSCRGPVSAHGGIHSVQQQQTPLGQPHGDTLRTRSGVDNLQGAAGLDTGLATRHALDQAILGEGDLNHPGLETRLSRTGGCLALTQQGFPAAHGGLHPAAPESVFSQQNQANWDARVVWADTSHARVSPAIDHPHLSAPAVWGRNPPPSPASSIAAEILASPAPSIRGRIPLLPNLAKRPSKKRVGEGRAIPLGADVPSPPLPPTVVTQRHEPAKLTAGTQPVPYPDSRSMIAALSSALQAHPSVGGDAGGRASQDPALLTQGPRRVSPRLLAQILAGQGPASEGPGGGPRRQGAAASPGTPQGPDAGNHVRAEERHGALAPVGGTQEVSQTIQGLRGIPGPAGQRQMLAHGEDAHQGGRPDFGEGDRRQQRREDAGRLPASRVTALRAGLVMRQLGGASPTRSVSAVAARCGAVADQLADVAKGPQTQAGGPRDAAIHRNRPGQALPLQLHHIDGVLPHAGVAGPAAAHSPHGLGLVERPDARFHQAACGLGNIGQPQMQSLAGLLSGSTAVKRAAARWMAAVIAAQREDLPIDDLLSRRPSPLPPAFPPSYANRLRHRRWQPSGPYASSGSPMGPSSCVTLSQRSAVPPPQQSPIGHAAVGVPLLREMTASLRSAGVTPAPPSRRSSAAGTPPPRPPSASPSPLVSSVSPPAASAGLNGPAFAVSPSPFVHTASGLLSLPENAEPNRSREASPGEVVRPTAAGPALTVASSGSVAQNDAGDTAQGAVMQHLRADAGNENIRTRQWRMGSPPLPTSQSVTNLADHFAGGNAGGNLGPGGNAPAATQPCGDGQQRPYGGLAGRTSSSAAQSNSHGRAAKDAEHAGGSPAGLTFPGGPSRKHSLEGGLSPQPSFGMFGLFSPTGMGSLVPSFGGAPSLGSLMDLRSLETRMGSEGGFEEAGTRPNANVAEEEDLMLPHHGLIRFPTDDQQTFRENLDLAGISLSPGRDTPVDGRVFESPPRSQGRGPRQTPLHSSASPAPPPVSPLAPWTNPFQAAAANAPAPSPSQPAVPHASAGPGSLSRHVADSQGVRAHSTQGGQDLLADVQGFDQGSNGGPGASVQSDPGGELCMRAERQVSVPAPHTNRKRTVRTSALQQTTPARRRVLSPTPVPNLKQDGSYPQSLPDTPVEISDGSSAPMSPERKTDRGTQLCAERPPPSPAAVPRTSLRRASRLAKASPSRAMPHQGREPSPTVQSSGPLPGPAKSKRKSTASPDVRRDARPPPARRASPSTLTNAGTGQGDARPPPARRASPSTLTNAGTGQGTGSAGVQSDVRRGWELQFYTLKGGRPQSEVRGVSTSEHAMPQVDAGAGPGRGRGRGKKRGVSEDPERAAGNLAAPDRASPAKRLKGREPTPTSASWGSLKAHDARNAQVQVQGPHTAARPNPTVVVSGQPANKGSNRRKLLVVSRQVGAPPTIRSSTPALLPRGSMPADTQFSMPLLPSDSPANSARMLPQRIRSGSGPMSLWVACSKTRRKSPEVTVTSSEATSRGNMRTSVDNIAETASIEHVPAPRSGGPDVPKTFSIVFPVQRPNCSAVPVTSTAAAPAPRPPQRRPSGARPSETDDLDAPKPRARQTTRVRDTPKAAPAPKRGRPNKSARNA